MSEDKPRVILLHGLWLHAPTMRWFAKRLRGEGFDARPHGYYSVLEDTPEAVAHITALLHRHPGSHIVGHSMGGLLAIRAATGLQDVPVGRIVCLGSPLAGSQAARHAGRRVGIRRALRSHRQLLEQGCDPIPAALEVGMVAGCVPRGLGGVMARFEDPVHDGTVQLCETRCEGLGDHVVVKASHAGLIFSDAALVQTLAFLRNGRFAHEGAVAMS